MEMYRGIVFREKERKKERKDKKIAASSGCWRLQKYMKENVVFDLMLF